MKAVAVTTFFCLLGIITHCHGCLLLFHSDGDHTLVGNHEDWIATDGAIRIVPPATGRYGSVIFTFLSEGWAQGGMNEKGLFFDAARTPYQEILFADGTTPPPNYIWQEVLDKAASVQEALDILTKYALDNLSESSIMLADASGHAAIVGVHNNKLDIMRVAGQHLLQTNFNRWHPELSEGPACTRYQKAEERLKRNAIVSVENMLLILEDTHQDSLTVYSNIYDLKNLTVYTYNKRNFTDPIVVRLPEYFRYGDCMISLDSLQSRPLLLANCIPSGSDALKISGIVLDNNGNPLPYVNIGLFARNIGTLSDPDGTFEIELPASSSNDSLIFSAIGFSRKKIPVALLGQALLQVNLEPESIVLKEVLVTDKRIHKKNARLGWMGGKDGVLPFDTIQGGGAVALLVESPSAPVFIDKLQVRLMYNSKDTVQLRFHIYAVDSVSEKPGEELLQKEIILRESNKRFGWLRFDLSEYQILITEKTFFIAFEWIDNRETRNEMLAGLRQWEIWKKEQFERGNEKVKFVPPYRSQTNGYYKYHGNMMDWPGFQMLPPFTGLMIETGKRSETLRLRTYERKTSFGQWTEIPSTLNAVVTVSY